MRPDYTRMAREVLGLSEHYPIDLSKSAVSSNGLYFRLLPATVKPGSTRHRAKHRLQVMCTLCLKWQNTGRMLQHRCLMGSFT